MNCSWVAILVAALGLAPIGGYAKESNPPAITQPAQPNETDLQSHGHYTNKQRQIVHSPSRSKAGAVPNGASAKCRDDSYSFSRNHRGTCSHHGGVAQWLN